MHVNVHVRFCSVCGDRRGTATLGSVEPAGRCEGAGAGADRPPSWDL
jgi:hypothetical protein